MSFPNHVGRRDSLTPYSVPLGLYDLAMVATQAGRRSSRMPRLLASESTPRTGSQSSSAPASHIAITSPSQVDQRRVATSSPWATWTTRVYCVSMAIRAIHFPPSWTSRPRSVSSSVSRSTWRCSAPRAHRPTSTLTPMPSSLTPTSVPTLMMRPIVACA